MSPVEKTSVEGIRSREKTLAMGKAPKNHRTGNGTQKMRGADRYRRKTRKKNSEKGDWQSQRIIVPMVRDAERLYRVGGELIHKGPTVGKVKPGITIY